MDSGAMVLAKRPGVVRVGQRRGRRDPSRRGERLVHDFTDYSGFDVYQLAKFRRSNQDTCINQSRSFTRDSGSRRDGPGGRSRHIGWNPGPRRQRPRRLHAVVRIQLRGCDRRQRGIDQARNLHFGPHRAVRADRPRHEAGWRRSPARFRTSATTRFAISTRKGSSASAPR